MDNRPQDPQSQPLPETPAVPPTDLTNQPSVGGTVIQPSASLPQDLQTKAPNNDQTPVLPPAPPLAPVSLPPAPSPSPGTIPVPTPNLSPLPQAAPPQKLHVGIYVIVGFLFLGFILGFFNTNSNALYDLLLFVNVALGIGILFKKELARKILIIFSTLLVILEIIVVVGLIGTQHAAHQKVANAQAILTNLENNAVLTKAEANQVYAYKAQISSEEATLNKTYTIAYLEAGIVITANIVLVVSLSRPSIKAVFTT